MICKRCKAEVPDGLYCLKCGAKQTRDRHRRANGEGSVYRLKNGRWIAIKTRFYLDSDGNMRRRSISASCASRKEAVAKLPTLNFDRPQARKSTFCEVFNSWLPTHKASKETLNCYKAAYKHFSALYDMDFAAITVDDIQAEIDECDKGKRTKQNMRTLCCLLYKYAIPRHLAPINMGEYLTVREEDISSREGLPLDALAKILASVGKVEGADIVACQCYLGFRPSELLALNVADYDRKEKAFTGGAKTDAGKNRIVTVSPKILPIVQRLTADRVGAVFSLDGRRMSIKEYRALFYRVLDEVGIENPIVEGGRRRYTPHSCRHTFATLMKRVKGSDKDKLALIGHTSDKMLRHYQDAPFEDLRRITDII